MIAGEITLGDRTYQCEYWYTPQWGWWATRIDWDTPTGPEPLIIQYVAELASDPDVAATIHAVLRSVALT